MDRVLKFLFERRLDNEDDEKSENADYKADSGYLPSGHYDPQKRLKRSLKALFPHLPGTPGLPASFDDEEEA